MQWIDKEGNSIEVVPEMAAPATVVLRAPDPFVTGKVLFELGFKQKKFNPAERRVFHKLAIDEADTWCIGVDLFAKRMVRIALRKDACRSGNPKVDDGGWNGLSFLTRDLAKIGERLPLVAHQNIPLSDERKGAIAFYSGEGLLLEFLQTTIAPKSAEREKN